MLKKAIEHTDFNGNTRTEDYYFNLTKAEIIELEAAMDGGLVEMIDRACKSQKPSELVSIFKTLIKKSYGVKTPDGRRFIKSPEVWAEFEQTEAYSKLFMELAFNAEAASAFVVGIIPPDLAQALQEAQEAKAATPMVVQEGVYAENYSPLQRVD